MIKEVRIKIHTVFLFFMVIFLWNGILWAGEHQTGSVGKVEDGVSIYDHDKDGRRIWELHGSSADFLDDGYIEIMDIEVLFYGEKKENDTVTLQSSSAQINQTDKKVRTDQPVTITTEGMVISGIGLTGDMGDSTVQILQNVVVILRGKNKDMFFPEVSADPIKNDTESVKPN